MKIEFELREKVGLVDYHVTISSPDGNTFRVVENGKKEVTYTSREEFLEDFAELESWFWPTEEEQHG